MSSTRLLWATPVLVVVLALHLISQPILASSKPGWAREGVYLIYGAKYERDKPIYDEELESTLNKWRFADIREFGLEVVEIRFVKVDEEKAVYEEISYGRIVTPGRYTYECKWDSGKCIYFGPLLYAYYDPNRIEEVLFKPETSESCHSSGCTIYVREIRETTFTSRFGALEIYEAVDREIFVSLDKTRKFGEEVLIFRIHKHTGILIEHVYLFQKTCPLNKTCWIAFLFVLLDINVPLGAKPPAQTTLQAAPTETPPTPVQTLTTPLTTTPISTPTQTETSTPAQQPVAIDRFSETILPIAVTVLVIVAAVVVFKLLRK